MRAKSPERAVVTVEKGKVTLRSSTGEALVLFPGETVEWVKGHPPQRSASFVATEPHHVAGRPPVIAEQEPRGLGRMTARVPGRTEVTPAFTSRLTRSTWWCAMASREPTSKRYFKTTPRRSWRRYVFPLPTDATISDLALWVNDRPVHGEIVEKKRAAAIFKGIVDDTVRPRDPALLEWVAGGDFSLKIFPLPAKGTRKVRIGYDQVLKESGGRIRYVYPLSVGAERATAIEEFAVHVQATDSRAPLGEIETPHYATSKSGEPGRFQSEFRGRSLHAVE